MKRVFPDIIKRLLTIFLCMLLISTSFQQNIIFAEDIIPANNDTPNIEEITPNNNETPENEELFEDQENILDNNENETEDSNYDSFDILIDYIDELISEEEINELADRVSIFEAKHYISMINCYVEVYQDVNKIAKLNKTSVEEIDESEILTEEQLSYYYDTLEPVVSSRLALLNNKLNVQGNYDLLSDVIKGLISSDDYYNSSDDFKTIVNEINSLPLTKEEINTILIDEGSNSDLSKLINFVTRTIPDEVSILSEEEQLLFNNSFGELIGPRKELHNLSLERRQELKGNATTALKNIANCTITYHLSQPDGISKTFVQYGYSVTSSNSSTAFKLNYDLQLNMSFFGQNGDFVVYDYGAAHTTYLNLDNIMGRFMAVPHGGQGWDAMFTQGNSNAAIGIASNGQVLKSGNIPITTGFYSSYTARIQSKASPTWAGKNLDVYITLPENWAKAPVQDIIMGTYNYHDGTGASTIPGAVITGDRTITVKKTYNGTDQTNGVDFSNIANGNFVVTSGNTHGTNAGNYVSTYTIVSPNNGIYENSFVWTPYGSSRPIQETAGYVVVNSDIAFGPRTVTLTIEKANAKVTAYPQGTTYGSPPPQWDCSIEGLKGIDSLGTLTYTITNSAGQIITPSAQTLPGTYTITPGGSTNSNYNVQYVSNTWRVFPLENPITVVAAQSGTKTFNATTAQTIDFTAASNAQGAVAYSIQSQKKGNTTVNYFSNYSPSSTGAFSMDAKFTMAPNTPAGTYTIVIRAQAEGNSIYKDAYKDITYTLTVVSADNPMTVTASQSGTKTFSTSAQTIDFTDAANAKGAVTYSIKSQKKGSTAVTYFTNPSPNTTGTFGMKASTPPGTYTIVVQATAAGDATYNSSTKEITYTLTVNKASNPMTVTATQSGTKPFSTSAQTIDFTDAASAQGAVTYVIKSQKKGSTTVSYFTNPSPNTSGTFGMKANTPLGTYTIVLTATAAGNTNYNSGSKDITYTLTVGKATNPITVTASQSGSKTFSTVAQTIDFTDATTAQGTVTYSIKSQKKGSSNVSYFTNPSPSSSGTFGMKASTPAGTYTIVVTATAAGNTNYELGSKDITYTLTVNPYDISTGSKIIVSGVNNAEYDGAWHEPSSIVVKNGQDQSTVLVLGTDYTMDAWTHATPSTTDPYQSTQRTYIRGKGNYKGSYLVTYVLTRKTYTVEFITGIDYADDPEVQNILYDFKSTNPLNLGYTLAGYEIEGWYEDQSKIGNTDYIWNFNTAIKKNTTLYADLRPNTNTPYRVEHYQQNTDGTYPSTPTYSLNMQGTTDTNVTPDIMTSYGDLGFTMPSSQTISIKGDGSSTVKYYYPRKTYTVTLNVNNSEYGAYSDGRTEIVIEGVRHGSVIGSEGAYIQIPNIKLNDDGVYEHVIYRAKAKASTDELTYFFSSYSTPFIAVTDNITITANFDKRVSTHTITFAVDKSEINTEYNTPAGASFINKVWGSFTQEKVEEIVYGTEFSINNNTVTIGDVNVVAIPAIQDDGYIYTFDHFNVSTTDNPQPYEGSTVNKALTITAHFTRTPRVYNVTLFSRSGTIRDGKNVTSYTYGVETTLPASVNDGAIDEADEIYRLGYDFNGWSFESSDPLNNYITSLTPGTYGEKNIYANWTAQDDIKYVVKHIKQGVDGTYPDVSDLDESDPSIGLEVEEFEGTTDSEVRPDVKTYDGFRNPTKQSKTIKADGSTVIVYEYERLKYPITFTSSNTSYGTVNKSYLFDVMYGEEVAIDNDELTIASTVVKATVKPDNDNYLYTFEGWLINESQTPTKSYTGTITEQTSFVAVFSRKVKEYAVTIHNYDESVLGNAVLVPYGTLVSEINSQYMAVDGLTKPEDHRATYSFNNKWGSSPNTYESDLKVLSNMDVYPYFDETIKSYNVIFHANDGKFEGDLETITVSIPYGSLMTEDMPVPTKTSDAIYDYEWVGWKVTPSAPQGGTWVDAPVVGESGFTGEENTWVVPTYYAAYQPTVKVDTYEITIQCNEATKDYCVMSESVVSNINVGSRISFTNTTIQKDNGGETIDIIKSSALKLTKLNNTPILLSNVSAINEDNSYFYRFDHWTAQKKDAEGNNIGSPVTLTGTGTFIVDSNVVVTAYFARIPRNYSLTFVPNCLDDSLRYVINDIPGTNPPVKYSVGTLTELPTLTRDNNIFLGWTLTNDESDTNYITSLSESDFGDKTYYAKWNSTDDYQFTLNTKSHYGQELIGGIALVSISPLPTSGTVKEGLEYTLKAQLETDDGAYEFESWYINGNKVNEEEYSTVGDNSVLTYIFNDANAKYDENGENPSYEIIAKYRYTQSAQGLHIYIEGDDEFSVSTKLTPTSESVSRNVSQLEGKYVFDGSIEPYSIITLHYEGQRAPEWLNDSNDVISSTIDYQLKAVINRNIYLKTVSKGEELTYYHFEARSDFDQIIESANITTLVELSDFINSLPKPHRLGKTFIDWVFEDGNSVLDTTTFESLNDYVGENTSNRIIITPKYEDNEDSEATITVISVLDATDNTRELSYTYSIGETVSLTAQNYAGLFFNCWANDINGNDVLGTSNSYPVHVGADRTIYAIYKTHTNTNVFPTIKVSLVTTEIQDNVNYLCFQVTRDIPDNVELLDQGVLCRTKVYESGTTNAEIENNLKFVEDIETGSVSTPANVKIYTDNSTAKHTGFTEHLKIGTNVDRTIYIRGYIIVSDGTREWIIYTDVHAMTYNAVLNNTEYLIIPTSTKDPEQEGHSEDDPFDD